MTSRRVVIPRDLPANALRGAGSGLPVCELEGETMGTSWSARLQLPRGLDREWAEAALTSSFALVIQQMSHWDPASELCRYNRGAPGSWHGISPEFFTVLSRAVDVARASGGLLDPTLGEIVDLHGHGPSGPGHHHPGRVPEARGRAGWERLRFDPMGRAWQPGGLRLDLSSIAKGYAVDLAAERLASLGVEHFLIEIGGELRGHGCKPDGEPWWVSLSRPSGSEDLPETVIALCGLSIATSGDAYRRHLIDPRTADAADGRLAAVTVLAPSCMDADAWATAFFIAGAEEGMRLAERERLPALFTLRHADGEDGGGREGCRYTEQWSPAFAAMLD
ncbi:FAD:protein FMN transferase [Luteolibacter flavescens]|uniref:FAD:protein FMN transferase n=1 Tax=Luteolibacter flavescens TaxID=1859460 RepID=A0ABT3FHU9_9BACT|nr:FAD:protein FMN transferase [Luteolibacter flavescens]MCW1883141.1 FAD:protein FMN transferase [Luteolibacter flavescens]